MEYFIVSASYNDPLPVTTNEVEAILPDHKEFVARGLRAGHVLCAGPKKSGNGGFIIIKATTRAALEDYISTDPYFQKGIQHYDITEFTPLDYQEYLKEWID
jgi:uncharacterized protein YciI